MLQQLKDAPQNSYWDDEPDGDAPSHIPALRRLVLMCHVLPAFTSQLDRCNPWLHVANRHISISQLLSSCCYLFTAYNSDLLSMHRPRPASHAHFRHLHIPELICGFNISIDKRLNGTTTAILSHIQRSRQALRSLIGSSPVSVCSNNNKQVVKVI